MTGLLPNMDSTTPNRAFSKQDYVWMDRARVMAGMSTERQKHGAVLVHAGRVLATGVNVFRNKPEYLSNPPTQASFHAEAMILRGLHKNHRLLGKATLYVARINNNFVPMMSRPCSGCWQEVVEGHDWRVVWTTGGYNALD